MEKTIRYFTDEEKMQLAMKPYTLSVTNHQIRFTAEFKRYMLEERDKNGTPWKEVFRKAGYDFDLIGKDRMDGIIKQVRKEAASPGGIKDTDSKPKINKEAKRIHTDKAIRDLQNEVIKLHQQIEFLKKIQQLKVLEENDKLPPVS